MPNTTNILITGASSGLGAALAKAYAMPGVVLGLMGRNQERLEKVAEYCKQKGAKVKLGIADVRDDEIVGEWIEHFDDEHPIDLLIANAGVSAGAGGQRESQKKLREIFAVNVDGVLNSVLPIIPRMQRRRQGHIAVMSSLAGIRGLPSCPAYSASKNAVRAFGEALRGDLKKDGVHVSVICPGYVRTPMTAVNEFPMPFIMGPERAADIIMDGIQKNKARVAFPLALYLPLWLISCLPVALTDPLFAMLPKKK